MKKWMLLCAAFCLHTSLTWANDLYLGSGQVAVTDLQSGEVLLSKNANESAPIASITKLMTAMVVIDSKPNWDERIKITEADVDHYRGSSSKLPVGTVLARKDMLRLALMSSENRAAHALARTYPGGVSAAVRAMNRKASDLRMRSSVFRDPTGLDEDNQASAMDLVRMVSTAGEYALIKAYSTSKEGLYKIGKRKNVNFRNTNRLIKMPDWHINLSKTGYISEAGKCLVMQASVNDKKFAIVLLNAGNSAARLQDAQRIKTWLENET